MLCPEGRCKHNVKQTERSVVPNGYQVFPIRKQRAVIGRRMGYNKFDVFCRGSLEGEGETNGSLFVPKRI